MATRYTGTVKFFNAQKGFGFVVPDNKPDPESRDHFVHISAFERAGLDSPKEGDRYSYELVTGKDGRMSADSLEVEG